MNENWENIDKNISNLKFTVDENYFKDRKVNINKS